MKPKDIRQLIDTFDKNSDGLITLAEFFEFVDANKMKKTSFKIEKCCFFTTDIVTG